MNTILYKYGVIGMCAILLSVSNTAFAGSKVETETYDVKLVSPAASNARIISIKVEEEKGKLFISGDVRRKQRFLHVSPGHIDVAVINSNGEVIIETTGSYSPKMVHKGSRRASRFKIELQKIPAKDSVINIAYHKTKVVADVNPEHDKNIAIK